VPEVDAERARSTSNLVSPNLPNGGTEKRVTHDASTSFGVVAAIRFFDPGATDFLKAADVYPDSLKQQLTAAEVSDTAVRLHQGLPGKLQLFEIRLEPGLEVSPHAHADDEIVYVVEGELRVGRRVCGAGSSFFVPGNTLYGFRAGPQGCRYLNFRAQADSTYFTKEDVVSARG
jgi:quercetin dioxygenase-like cupin family protein